MKIVLVALTCFILGGAAVYSFNQYQIIEKENKELKLKVKSDTGELSPAPKGMVVISPTGEKVMDEKKAEGSIQGTLGYPSSGIPELFVYAFDSTNEKKYFMIETAVNQMTFTMNGIPAGSYYVVAYAKDYAVSGAYTKMVPCGLSVECTDHSMIAVTVLPGETTKGVEVKDWYAPEGTFPKKP